MTARRRGVAINLPPFDRAIFDQVTDHGRWIGVTLRERLESKYIPEPMSGCWLWIGAINRNGYPQISVSPRGEGRKSLSAHRLMYEMEIGPFPDGTDACHKCDIRSCVNPSHIFPGEVGANIKDMKSKGRSRGAVGVLNTKAKITEVEVRLIRGECGKVTEISKKYGMSTSQVSAIRNLKSWSHVK